MNALLTKIIAAFFVVAALAGCAATGDSGSAMEDFDRVNAITTAE